jgi:hypothetical protein
VRQTLRSSYMSDGRGLISILLGNAISLFLASLGDSTHGCKNCYNLKRDHSNSYECCEVGQRLNYQVDIVNKGSL